MALFDFLTLSPKTRIGSIEIAAALEEIHTDALQVTEHPVELGASITDHAYKRPSEVVLRCGWSNSALDVLTAAVSAFFRGGEVSKADYISGVYSQLLALQESRIPFEIATSKRRYTNMLLVGLQVTTDEKTSNILMVQATCREIIIVNTQATTLPPRDAQAFPEDTAEIENAGTKQLQTGTPSQGGSLPPQ